jgi:hypothetical protein
MPRASRLTTRRLCSGLTACHGSRSCPVGRRLEPRFSGAAAARDRSGHPAERTHRYGWGDRVRPRVLAWRRGHRFQESRWRRPVRACRVWIKVRNPPASLCSGSEVRFGVGDHREAIELGKRQTDFTQSRIHDGQSVKTGSSLARSRRHCGELSDDDLTPTCLGRADRDPGFCRSVLGGGGSRVVRVRHHLVDLGLQPLTQRFAFWLTIDGTRPLRPTLACCVRLTPMCLTCRIKGRRRYGDDPPAKAKQDGPDIIPSSVANQEEFAGQWMASLRK